MKYALIFSLFYLLSQGIIAQIPVHEEPLHRVIFEDEQIRILEIIAQPGDTAVMHQHDYNYCFIAVEGGRMWLEDQGEESRQVNLPTHYAGGKFELSKGPFVHRFANIDSTQISFFTLEHKTGTPLRALPSVLPDDTVVSSPLFTIRKVALASLSSQHISHEGTVVLLNLSQTPLLLSSTESIAYWKRFGAKEEIYISNMEKELKSIAVFEVY